MSIIVTIDPDLVWHRSGLVDREETHDDAEDRFVDLKIEIAQEATRRGLRVWWDTYSGRRTCWAVAICKCEVYRGCACDEGCD